LWKWPPDVPVSLAVTEHGKCLVGGNRGIAMAHLFLAREAKRVQEPQKGDALEEQ
jgi:hypothetical protein